MKKRKSKQVAISIPAELHEKFVEYCDDYFMSFSEFVRLAGIEYMRRQNEKDEK